MRRFLVLFVFLSLIAAACGDDGSSAGSGGDDTGGDDTAGDDTAGDDTAGDDGDDTSGGDDGDDTSGGDDGDDTSGGDDGGDDTSGGDDGGDDGGDGGGAGTGFCATYVDDQIRVDGLSLATATPEEIENTFRSNLDTARSIADTAPGEISGDVDTLISSFEVVIDELEAVDWNFLLIDPTSPAFDDPEAEAAGDRIDAFCGVADPDPIDGIPPDFLPDPDLLEGLGDLNNPDAALLFYQALGHDEATAQCLVEELGALDEPDEVSPDLFSQEFCGLTFLEIFAGGAG